MKPLGWIDKVTVRVKIFLQTMGYHVTENIFLPPIRAKGKGFLSENGYAEFRGWRPEL